MQSPNRHIFESEEALNAAWNTVIVPAMKRSNRREKARRRFCSSSLYTRWLWLLNWPIAERKQAAISSDSVAPLNSIQSGDGETNTSPSTNTKESVFKISAVNKAALQCSNLVIDDASSEQFLEIITSELNEQVQRTWSRTVAASRLKQRLALVANEYQAAHRQYLKSIANSSAKLASPSRQPATESASIFVNDTSAIFDGSVSSPVTSEKIGEADSPDALIGALSSVALRTSASFTFAFLRRAWRTGDDADLCRDVLTDLLVTLRRLPSASLFSYSLPSTGGVKTSSKSSVALFSDYTDRLFGFLRNAVEPTAPVSVPREDLGTVLCVLVELAAQYAHVGKLVDVLIVLVTLSLLGIRNAPLRAPLRRFSHLLEGQRLPNEQVRQSEDEEEEEEVSLVEFAAAQMSVLGSLCKRRLKSPSCETTPKRETEELQDVVTAPKANAGTSTGAGSYLRVSPTCSAISPRHSSSGLFMLRIEPRLVGSPGGHVFESVSVDDPNATQSGWRILQVVFRRRFAAVYVLSDAGCVYEATLRQGASYYQLTAFDKFDSFEQLRVTRIWTESSGFASSSGVFGNSSHSEQQHFVALASDGSLFAWGANRFGQCGVGRACDSLTAPARIGALPAGKSVVAVVCGAEFTLVLLVNGELYAFGRCEHGRDHYNPLLLTSVRCKRVMAMAAGSCVRDSVCVDLDGSVFELGCGDSRCMQGCGRPRTVLDRSWQIEAVESFVSDNLHVNAAISRPTPQRRVILWQSTRYSALVSNEPSVVMQLTPLGVTRISLGASGCLCVTDSGALLHCTYLTESALTSTSPTAPRVLTFSNMQPVRVTSCAGRRSLENMTLCGSFNGRFMLLADAVGGEPSDHPSSTLTAASAAAPPLKVAQVGTKLHEPFVIDVRSRTFESLLTMLNLLDSHSHAATNVALPPESTERMMVSICEILALQLNVLVSASPAELATVRDAAFVQVAAAWKSKLIELTTVDSRPVPPAVRASAQTVLRCGWSLLFANLEERVRTLVTFLEDLTVQPAASSEGRGFMLNLLTESLLEDDSLLLEQLRAPSDAHHSAPTSSLLGLIGLVLRHFEHQLEARLTTSTASNADWPRTFVRLVAKWQRVLLVSLYDAIRSAQKAKRRRRKGAASRTATHDAALKHSCAVLCAYLHTLVASLTKMLRVVGGDNCWDALRQLAGDCRPLFTEILAELVHSLVSFAKLVPRVVAKRIDSHAHSLLADLLSTLNTLLRVALPLMNGDLRDADGLSWPSPNAENPFTVDDEDIDRAAAPRRTLIESRELDQRNENGPCWIVLFGDRVYDAAELRESLLQNEQLADLVASLRARDVDVSKLDSLADELRNNLARFVEDERLRVLLKSVYLGRLYVAERYDDTPRCSVETNKDDTVVGFCRALLDLSRALAYQLGLTASYRFGLHGPTRRAGREACALAHSRLFCNGLKVSAVTDGSAPSVPCDTALAAVLAGEIERDSVQKLTSWLSQLRRNQVHDADAEIDSQLTNEEATLLQRTELTVFCTLASHFGYAHLVEQYIGAELQAVEREAADLVVLVRLVGHVRRSLLVGRRELKPLVDSCRSVVERCRFLFVDVNPAFSPECLFDQLSEAELNGSLRWRRLVHKHWPRTLKAPQNASRWHQVSASLLSTSVRDSFLRRIAVRTLQQDAALQRAAFELLTTQDLSLNALRAELAKQRKLADARNDSLRLLHLAVAHDSLTPSAKLFYLHGALNGLRTLHAASSVSAWRVKKGRERPHEGHAAWLLSDCRNILPARRLELRTRVTELVCLLLSHVRAHVQALQYAQNVALLVDGALLSYEAIDSRGGRCELDRMIESRSMLASMALLGSLIGLLDSPAANRALNEGLLPLAAAALRVAGAADDTSLMLAFEAAGGDGLPLLLQNSGARRKQPACSGRALANVLRKGMRVRPGADWKWLGQGSGVGRVISDGVHNGWVRVRWRDGAENSYRMGREDKYDLELASPAELDSGSDSDGFDSEYDDLLVDRDALNNSAGGASNIERESPRDAEQLFELVESASQLVVKRVDESANDGHGEKQPIDAELALQYAAYQLLHVASTAMLALARASDDQRAASIASATDADPIRSAFVQKTVKGQAASAAAAAKRLSPKLNRSRPNAKSAVERLNGCEREQHQFVIPSTEAMRCLCDAVHLTLADATNRSTNSPSSDALLRMHAHRNWATLSLVGALCTTEAFARALAAPHWLDTLVRVATNEPPSLRGFDLTKRLQAIRVLAVVAPRADRNRGRAVLRELVRFAGACLRTSYLDQALFSGALALSRKKHQPPIALTASFSSTLANEVVSLLRTLHGHADAESSSWICEMIESQLQASLALLLTNEKPPDSALDELLVCLALLGDNEPRVQLGGWVSTPCGFGLVTHISLTGRVLTRCAGSGFSSGSHFRFAKSRTVSFRQDELAQLCPHALKLPIAKLFSRPRFVRLMAEAAECIFSGAGPRFAVTVASTAVQSQLDLATRVLHTQVAYALLGVVTQLLTDRDRFVEMLTYCSRTEQWSKLASRVDLSHSKDSEQSTPLLTPQSSPGHHRQPAETSGQSDAVVSNTQYNQLLRDLLRIAVAPCETRPVYSFGGLRRSVLATLQYVSYLTHCPSAALHHMLSRQRSVQRRERLGHRQKSAANRPAGSCSSKSKRQKQKTRQNRVLFDFLNDNDGGKRRTGRLDDLDAEGESADDLDLLSHPNVKPVTEMGFTTRQILRALRILMPQSLMPTVPRTETLVNWLIEHPDDGAAGVSSSSGIGGAALASADRSARRDKLVNLGFDRRPRPIKSVSNSDPFGAARPRALADLSSDESEYLTGLDQSYSSDDDVLRRKKATERAGSDSDDEDNSGSSSRASSGADSGDEALPLLSANQLRSYFSQSSAAESASASAGLQSVRIGDRVKVRDSVSVPAFKWGNVMRSSVGVVRSVGIDGRVCSIDFPTQRDWRALVSELERLQPSHAAVACCACFASPIVGTRFECVRCTARNFCEQCFEQKLIDRSSASGTQSSNNQSSVSSAVGGKNAANSFLRMAPNTLEQCAGHRMRVYVVDGSLPIGIVRPNAMRNNGDSRTFKSRSSDRSRNALQPATSSSVSGSSFVTSWKACLKALTVSSNAENAHRLIDGRGAFWQSAAPKPSKIGSGIGVNSGSGSGSSSGTNAQSAATGATSGGAQMQAGANGRHWIRIELQPNWVIRKLTMRVNPGDRSYLPSLVLVSVGNSVGALQDLPRLTVKQTDTRVTLLQACDESYRFVQISVLQCYNEGVNCRIFSLDIECYQVSDMPEAAEAARRSTPLTVVKKNDDAPAASDATEAAQNERASPRFEFLNSDAEEEGKLDLSVAEPRVAANSADWRASVAARQFRTLVFAFGLNDKGQLGIGASESTAGPSSDGKVKAPTLCEALSKQRVSQIVGGAKSLFAVTSDGRVYVAGECTGGRLGLGASAIGKSCVLQPTQLRALAPFVIRKMAVQSGGRHCLALTADGQVFSWGQNTDGECGLGFRSNAVDEPRLIDVFRGRVVRDVACGSAHSAAILQTGELFTWGSGEYGRLGHGDTTTQLRPKLVAALQGNRVIQVACGSRDAQTLALTDDGTVFSWGDGDFGKTGRGGSECSLVPLPIDSLQGLGIVQVECGAQFSLCVTAAGQLYVFGKGDYYRLGLGHTEHVRKPQLVDALKDKRIVRVAVGALHWLALSADGLVYACGDNDFYQQGNATGQPNRIPSVIAGFEGLRVLNVACGSSHSFVWAASADADSVSDADAATDADSFCVSTPYEPLQFAVAEDPLGLSHASLQERGSAALTVCENGSNEAAAAPPVPNFLTSMDEQPSAAPASTELPATPSLATQTVAKMDEHLAACLSELESADQQTAAIWQLFDSWRIQLARATSLHVLSLLDQSRKRPHKDAPALNNIVCNILRTEDGLQCLLGLLRQALLGRLSWPRKSKTNAVDNQSVPARVRTRAERILLACVKRVVSQSHDFIDVLLDRAVSELEHCTQHTGVGQSRHQPVVQESPHPYDDNCKLNGTVRLPGAVALRIEFDPQCSTERRHDTLTISDARGNVVAVRSGREWADWSAEVRVTGDEMRWTFVSDASVNGWGFLFTVHPVVQSGAEMCALSDRRLAISPCFDMVRRCIELVFAALGNDSSDQCQLEPRVADTRPAKCEERDPVDEEVGDRKRERSAGEDNAKRAETEAEADGETDCERKSVVQESGSGNTYERVLESELATRRRGLLLAYRLVEPLTRCLRVARLSEADRLWTLKCLRSILAALREEIATTASQNAPDGNSLLLNLVELAADWRFSFLQCLATSLPDMLLAQFEYESPFVQSSKQLTYSDYLRSLMALAADLNIDAVITQQLTQQILGRPTSSTSQSISVQKWSWFKQYCYVRRTAKAVAYRRELPFAFRTECTGRINELLSLSLSPLVDRQPLAAAADDEQRCLHLAFDHEVFRKEQDEALLVWYRREPESWSLSSACSTEVYCFGHNHRGQLALVDGSKVRMPTFCDALSALKPIQLAGGEQTLFAVSHDGRVYACGYAAAGRLGIKSTESVTTPTLLTSLQHVVVKKVAVNSGGKHCLALTADGDVYSWGSGDDGALGHGNRTTYEQPTLIEALRGRQIVDIAAGGAHSAAISSSGELYTWGKGRYGRLGHDSMDDFAKPKLVEALRGYRVVDVSCGSGDAQTLAVTDDDSVWSWGDGDYGKLGRGGSESSKLPVKIETLQNVGVCKVECGSQFSVALTKSGAVYSWGKGDYFRLGHGSDEHVRKPKRIAALQGKRVVQIACGSLHCVCVTDQCEVYCWGDGDEGQLGDGSTTAATKPKLLAALSSKRINRVACGSAHTVVWSSEPSAGAGKKPSPLPLGSVSSVLSAAQSNAGPSRLSPVPVSTSASTSAAASSSASHVRAVNAASSVVPFAYSALAQIPVRALRDRLIVLQKFTELIMSVYAMFPLRADPVDPSLLLAVPRDAADSKSPLNAKPDAVSKAPQSHSGDSAESADAKLARRVYATACHFEELSLDMLRSLLLSGGKEALLKRIIQATMLRDKPHGPLIEINRIALKNLLTEQQRQRETSALVVNAPASAATTVPKKDAGAGTSVARAADLEAKTVVMQVAARIRQLIESRAVLLPNRVWKVKFVGESVDDCGGGYSESIVEMCDELQNCAVLSLLAPTPNSRDEDGANQDCFVLNPTRRGAAAYEFLGLILGVALRTGAPLSLNLAEPIWRLLVGESLQLSDLNEIDKQFVTSLASLVQLDATSLFDADLAFSCSNSLGEQVPLRDPQAERYSRLTVDTREEYVRDALHFRLHEFDRVAAAVRAGLGRVVPLPLLSLLTGNELETLVCGSADIPVETLKAIAVYKGADPTDPLISWLWDTLAEFSSAERALFLRFVWGRTRLPRTVADFRGRDFVIQVLDKYAPADIYLPESYTCFFLLKLPRYSQKAVLREKLRYAIHYCKSIDIDEYARVQLCNAALSGADRPPAALFADPDAGSQPARGNRSRTRQRSVTAENADEFESSSSSSCVSDSDSDATLRRADTDMDNSQPNQTAADGYSAPSDNEHSGSWARARGAAGASVSSYRQAHAVRSPAHRRPGSSYRRNSDPFAFDELADADYDAPDRLDDTFRLLIARSPREEHLVPTRRDDDEISESSLSCTDDLLSFSSVDSANLRGLLGYSNSNSSSDSRDSSTASPPSRRANAGRHAHGRVTRHSHCESSLRRSRMDNEQSEDAVGSRYSREDGGSSSFSAAVNRHVRERALRAALAEEELALASRLEDTADDLPDSLATRRRGLELLLQVRERINEHQRRAEALLNRVDSATSTAQTQPSATSASISRRPLAAHAARPLSANASANARTRDLRPQRIDEPASMTAAARERASAQQQRDSSRNLTGPTRGQRPLEFVESGESDSSEQQNAELSGGRSLFSFLTGGSQMMSSFAGRFSATRGSSSGGNGATNASDRLFLRRDLSTSDDEFELD